MSGAKEVQYMVYRVRLNEKTVREAVPAEGKDYQIFDTEARGFPAPAGTGLRDQPVDPECPS